MFGRLSDNDFIQRLPTADSQHRRTGSGVRCNAWFSAMFHSFKAIGEYFLDRGFNFDGPLEAFMSTGNTGGRHDIQEKALLVALLDEIKGLRRDIRAMPKNIETERCRAAIELAERTRKEAERAARAPHVAAMNRADKERRAAEAKLRADASKPPEVVEIAVAPRELERLVDRVIEKGGEFVRY